MPDVRLVRSDIEQLFRSEALEQYQRGRTDEGHVLEIEPRWMRLAPIVVIAAIATSVLFGALLRVDRVIEGTGVIRDGRVIASIATADRAHVRVGAPLRFERVSQPLTITATTPVIVATLPKGTYRDGLTGRVFVHAGRERLGVALLRFVRGAHA